MKERLLISACLLGRNCKYSGGNNYHPLTEALRDRYELVPVCPECMGGLPIPHDPAERVGDKVISRTGTDVTAEFKKGAELALRRARQTGAKLALLKERSPSCGCGAIYDGTFTGTVVPGSGVTAALLAKNGVMVYGESRIEELLRSKEILHTQRLTLREMTQDDFPALCRILQDPQVMYAYEGPFSDEEVQDWLDRQITRYRQWGFGLWAVVLQETGEMIGQCGLTMQPWKDQQVLEIGYLLQRAYWHQGYATEAAAACREYAFHTLGAEEVCSIIRDTNTASQQVALRCGMTRSDNWIKHYRGIDMPHYRYVIRRK